MECKCGEFNGKSIEVLDVTPEGIYDFRIHCKCGAYINLLKCQIIGYKHEFPEESGVIEMTDFILTDEGVIQMKQRYKNTTKGGKVLPMEG